MSTALEDSIKKETDVTEPNNPSVTRVQRQYANMTQRDQRD